MESERHDPDDGRGLAVEQQRPPNRAPSATEPASCKSLTDDGNALPSPFLIQRISAAFEWRYAKHAKHRCGRSSGVQTFRLGDAGQCEWSVARGEAEFRERPALFLPISVERMRNQRFVKLPPHVISPQDDETLSILIRQWLENDRIEQAKDGGIGADAKAKTQDGNRREAGTLAKCSKRVPDIGDQLFD